MKLKNNLFCFNLFGKSLNVLNVDMDFHYGKSETDDITKYENTIKKFFGCENIFFNGNYSDKYSLKWGFFYYRKVKNNKCDMNEFNKIAKNF